MIDKEDQSSSKPSPESETGSFGDGSEGVLIPPSPPGEMKFPGEVLRDLPDPASAPAGPTKPGAGGFEMPGAGSNRAGSNRDNTPSQQDQGSNASNTASTPGRVSYAHWSVIEKELKSDGKITVVDFWSTSCEPCLRELPGLVRLQQAVGSSVRCVAINVDFDGRDSRPPEFYLERTEAFLSSINASFEQYICRTPSEDVYATVGIVSIPAVLVYDANGRLVKKFVDAGETLGFTYDKDVLPLVDAMVNAATNNAATNNAATNNAATVNASEAGQKS